MKKLLGAAVIAIALSSPVRAADVAFLSGGAGCPLFTSGLHQIAAQLQAHGVQASVGCNFNISGILTHRGDHVVLIGHSYGAYHAGIAAAQLLRAGMRVKVIGIDPLYTNAGCSAGSDCICFYGQGFPMRGARNLFVASSYGHIGYPADPRVQTRVIAAALRR